jgi:DNA polymerase III subunit epsilon
MPRYLIIDTETSGLPLRAAKGQPPIPADAPGQPRLASFTAIATTPDLEAAKVALDDARKQLPFPLATGLIDEDMSISTLIRPEVFDTGPEWRMSEGATKVNGITDEMLQADGIPVRDVLAIYSDYIQAGWIVVAHNAQFDTKVMRGELRRAGMPDLFEQTLNICTMRACTDIVREAPTDAMMATGRRTFKPPKLMECYRHFYGCDFAGAHTSYGDSVACLMVLRKLIELGKCPEPSILRAASRED